MTTVVAVVGTIAGAGTTTVVTALGAALGEQRRRVALVDAIEEGSRIDDVIEITGGGDLTDALRRGTTVGDVQAAGPHDVAAFPANADTSWGAVRPDAVDALYDGLRERFDFVLVDAGNELSPASAAWLGHADEALIVTDPDVAGAVPETVALAGAFDVPVRGVLASRVPPKEVSDALDALAATDQQVLGVLPEDPTVGVAEDAGISVLRAEPDSPIATCAWALARRFRERAHDDPVVPTGTGPSPGDGSDAIDDGPDATDSDADATGDEFDASSADDAGNADGDAGDTDDEGDPEDTGADGSTAETIAEDADGGSSGKQADAVAATPVDSDEPDESTPDGATEPAGTAGEQEGTDETADAESGDPLEDLLGDVRSQVGDADGSSPAASTGAAGETEPDIPDETGIDAGSPGAETGVADDPDGVASAEGGAAETEDGARGDAGPTDDRTTGIDDRSTGDEDPPRSGADDPAVPEDDPAALDADPTAPADGSGAPADDLAGGDDGAGETGTARDAGAAGDGAERDDRAADGEAAELSDEEIEAVFKETMERVQDRREQEDGDEEAEEAEEERS